MQGKLLLPLAILIALGSGCESNAPVASAGPEPVAVPPRQLSAIELESRANLEQGGVRNATLLQAAGLRLEAGEWDAALGALGRLGLADLSAAQNLRAQLLSARAYRQLGQTDAALASLSTPPADTLATPLQAEFHQLRAELHEAANQPIAAAEQRIRLDALLTDIADRLNNQTQILLTLGAAPSAELRQFAEQRSGITLGWVDLVRSLRVYPAGRTLTEPDLAVWRSRYTQHPARLAAMQAALPGIAQAYQPINRLALLVPESGPLEAIGRAVRDGFLAAHYTVPVGERPDIRIIDSAAASDITNLYQELTAAGVSRVVGPISKDKIAALAALPERPVPVLAMNTLQNDPAAHEKLYQFGLLPEHDARNLAERVIFDQRGQVALLVPDNNWGQRIAGTFRQRLAELGGRVIAQGDYDPQSFNNGTVVRDMLGIDESPTAVARRTSIIDGKEVTADPVPDKAIQAIVIAAYPQQARLLRPLLNFYYAAHLPVYASSQVYSGTPDPLQDKDLNGLVFGDLPWVLHAEQFGELSRSNIERQFPVTRSNLLRLFALGADAYRLAADERQLAQVMQDPGLTGWLTVDSRNRVQRELAWAQFNKGLAVAESLPNASEPVSDETTIAPAVR